MNVLNGWILLLGLIATQPAQAQVRLPTVFGSHMVLQRRQPVPVWGWASPGEKIKVSIHNQTKTTQATQAGKWRVILDAMEAGGPCTLIVAGKTNTLSLDDVLLGEVWVCSGQSNMEWPLQSAANGNEEIKAATYPAIRQFMVKKALSITPNDDLTGKWTVCSPQTAASYSAVGYFFVRQLHKELNVPIGLVNTTWGGTVIETWLSREAMSQDTELQKGVEKLPRTEDEVIRDGQARINRLATQQGGLPTPSEEQTWANPALATDLWKPMNVPGDWEWRGLPAFDGVLWLRRDVMLPEDANLQKMTLQLGPINDSDSTFVNGHLIGSTKARTPRRYVIPAGILKPGRNVIAVRVANQAGAGGLTGKPDQLYLSDEILSIPLAGEWKYRIVSAYPTSFKPGPNTYPIQIFNAMVNPLIPFAIQGVIWYQGESNADRAYQYRRTFPLMIRDWRQRWGRDFPFLFVQLANFQSGSVNREVGGSWAELREAQAMTLQLPNTGMAVTADIGESKDIHPKNKQDVGKRLAAEAIRVVYAEKSVAETAVGSASRGPMFEQLRIDGNRAIVSFRYVGSGLRAKDKYGYLKGFSVAGANHKFYHAKAEIQGNSVVVHADSVTTPVAVRYGWANDNGEVNLYNNELFPAVPFRTDSWKGLTETAKFGDP